FRNRSLSQFPFTGIRNAARFALAGERDLGTGACDPTGANLERVTNSATPDRVGNPAPGSGMRDTLFRTATAPWIARANPPLPGENPSPMDREGRQGAGQRDGRTQPGDTDGIRWRGALLLVPGPQVLFRNRFQARCQNRRAA